MTCTEDSEIWTDPGTIASRIERHLVEVRALKSPDRIESLHIENISNTYPVYRLGYREELERVKSDVLPFRNLRLLGRTGTFWYNNMDHSIRMALDMAKEITGETSPAG